MPRRRRRPSKYRFVGYLGVPVACAGVLIVTRIGAAVACRMLHSASPTAPCTPYQFPSFITIGLWIVIVIGVGLAGRQWYQDFVKKSYLSDD